MSVFSLHARKIVTTGEGGMIVTNDPDLAAWLRRQRHQGMSLTDFERHGALPTQFETYPEIGYNFRLTDMQAAVGVEQLKRLPEMLRKRRSVALRYLSGLSANPALAMPSAPDHVQPNWQSFQVAVTDQSPLSRNALLEGLHRRGIACRRGVMAAHLEPPYRGRGMGLARTEHSAGRGLQLPIHSSISDEDVGYVIASVRELTAAVP